MSSRRIPAQARASSTHAIISWRIAGPPSLAGVSRLPRPRIRFSALTTPASIFVPPRSTPTTGGPPPCHVMTCAPNRDSRWRSLCPEHCVQKSLPDRDRLRNTRGAESQFGSRSSRSAVRVSRAACRVFQDLFEIGGVDGLLVDQTSRDHVEGRSLV